LEEKEIAMKKLATFVLALLIATGISFAQDTGGDKIKNTQSKAGNPAASSKKTGSGKKAHKGGKKSKNSGSGNNYGGTGRPPK
jgi:hypothetical protein